jgi:LuxR family transcriptional regulator, quorum-sensing system regulator CciR
LNERCEGLAKDRRAVKRLSDRFAESASSCMGLDQLRALLAEAAAELGFSYFALLDHCSLGSPDSRLLRIDNYPEAWVSELVDGGFAADDPVHFASVRANGGFNWADLPRLVKLGRGHWKILERSRRFGIGEGFTVPANVPGEPSASCSFAVRAGRDLPLGRLRCAELVGVHALAAARRLRPVSQRPGRPHLSRRQLECLRLLAIGKTDWEIARILGLSTETAHQYVKRARSAYDAVSRTQLVVYGLRDSWISFEEAIPPYW